jgi:aspartyl-tRNA(Asn)/glutamyl-tRNA(Gln) amidotransferase subunit A
MSAELNRLSLAAAADLIAAKKLSPVELTETCLAGIEAVDATLCSFVTPTPELAREQARAAEAEIMRSGPRSPLHGVPYSLKDIYETRGIRTTGQSRVLANYVPTEDCLIQTKLQEAGGVLVGKNTTWEFAHGGPSWDVVAPPARNPWNTDRHPAGSSSGSAAALAAGLCLATMGSDTGGSIRQPAAACGIAGIKPTYGRLSRRGILPNSFSHDHAGPLAWNCEDLAILMQLTAGYDPLDPGSANVAVPDYRAALTGNVKGLTIGVPYRWMEKEAPISAASRRAIDSALDVFKSLGATVKSIELPPILEFSDAKRIIAMSELFAIHEADLRSTPELFGASLRYRIMGGSLLRAEDYVQAMRMRTVLAQAVQNVFADVDLIAVACNEPAGKLVPTSPQWMFEQASYSTPFNVSGNPALSICNGFAEDGMPFSLQLAGRLFDEATVLCAGDAYERATPWRDRRPTFATDADLVTAEATSTTS